MSRRYVHHEPLLPTIFNSVRDIASALALYVASSVYPYGMFMTGDEHEYANDLREIHRVAGSSDRQVVASWWDGVAYEYYNRDSGDREDAEWVDELQLGAGLTEWNRPFLLVESYRPSRIATLLLSESVLGARRGQLSSVSRAQRTIGAECRLVFSNLLEVYECVG